MRSTGGTDEQRHPEHTFQARHALGDGLLADAQLHGGFLELSGVRDGDGRAHGFDVHALNPMWAQPMVVARRQQGGRIRGFRANLASMA